MKRLLWMYLFGAFGAMSAQAFQQPTRAVDFQVVEQRPGVYRLEPQLPPLQPIPGAPAPFWRLFWELGDGNFSFAATPEYGWLDTGTYELRLWATGAYDNGRPPRDRPKKKRIARPRPSQYAQAFPLQNVLTEEAPELALAAIREPVPEQQLLFILSYANAGQVPLDGQLHLFFNEQAYPARHFEFAEARTYWGERPLPPDWAWADQALTQEAPQAWASTSQMPPGAASALDAFELLARARSTFRESVAWEFSALQPGETRNLFVVLEGTPQMLADTNATIRVRALMTPSQGEPRAYDLEMSIATGNDPNRLSVRRPRRSYRGLRRQHYDWRIQFQNDGKGPVERVQLDFFVNGMDTSKVHIRDVKPPMPPCTDQLRAGCYTWSWRSDEHLQLVLHDIYLPGSRQPGVRQYDSTQGHVKLRLYPKPKWPKRPVRGRVEIVFDKEPPIRTNRASVRFKSGLSPGLMAGWRAQQAGLKNSLPGSIAGSQTNPYFTLGLSLSPFKPRRYHWQTELWAGLQGSKPVEAFSQTVIPLDTILPHPGSNFTVVRDSIVQTFTSGTVRTTSFALVPLHGRYNLTSFLSAGAGIEVQITAQRRQGTLTHTAFVESSSYFVDASGNWVLEFSEMTPPVTTSAPLDTRQYQWQVHPFVELQVASVRWGPALGLRAAWQLVGDKREWRWMCYAQFRL